MCVIQSHIDFVHQLFDGSEGDVRSGLIDLSQDVGFWTDKGNADQNTLELLGKLRNKKIFLFGTAGFGGSEAYYQNILANVRKSIDASNRVIGEYMCQGKMPLSVRERYEKMKEQPEHPANVDALIENFDRALAHPDADDLEKLRNIVTEG